MWMHLYCIVGLTTEVTLPYLGTYLRVVALAPKSYATPSRQQQASAPLPSNGNVSYQLFDSS